MTDPLMKPEDFATGFAQAVSDKPVAKAKPMRMAQANAKIRTDYWDIAIAPIRADTLAVSFHRLFGNEKFASVDGKYICEASRDNLATFWRKAMGVIKGHHASLLSSQMEIQVSWTKDGLELFVGSAHGRARAVGHSGPITVPNLESILSATVTS